MNLFVTHRDRYAPPVEFVERKWIGHPDTICDRLSEEFARHLAASYLEHTGRVQPFNVDKAVLAAGSVEVGFGGGTHTRPSRMVLVGRADFSHGYQPDIAALEVELKRRLLGLLPDADPAAFTLEIWLNPSSVDLAAVVTAGLDVPLANDTSFAAVSVPLSPLEATVHEVERTLNEPVYRSRVPVGRDIKVMGARFNGSVTITVACPVMAAAVSDRDAYDAVVAEVHRTVTAVAAPAFAEDLSVKINQADQDDSPYLTVSGTSAEAGDDGQVGRGNRFGGLITPYRPMSLEATAGKNPHAHVGKTYHAIGFDIATSLVTGSGAEETTIRLLSSIGHPVTEPQAVHVEVVGDVDDAAIAATAKEHFDDWAGVRDRLIAGDYELF